MFELYNKTALYSVLLLIKEKAVLTVLLANATAAHFFLVVLLTP